VLNPHSFENSSANNDSSVTSLMQKIIMGSNGPLSKIKAASSKEPSTINEVSQRSRNYKFKVGSAGVNLVSSHHTAAGNYPNLGNANFGLGNIGSLGSYLSKGTNAVLNVSAYASNTSDLIRGFKSSQSIPVVTSQQASIHQISR